MISTTEPDVVPATEEIPEIPPVEVLFKEAKARERRRRLTWLGAAFVTLALVAVLVGATMNAFGSTPSSSGASTSALASTKSAGLLSCNGASVTKPTNFVITCADANTQLTKTQWTKWTASGARGTTRFAMNLCVPYCAASPMSYFANSKVDLSAPVKTSKGTFFSLMVVHYTQNGKAKTYRFSWKGDPSF
jgi:hypothetical protein